MPGRICFLPAAVAGAMLVAGCGGSSTPPSGGPETTANRPPAATHADAVTLLPTPADVRLLLNPSSAPRRSNQVLNPNTLDASFGPAAARVAKLGASAAELDASGKPGTFLYAHVYVFSTVPGATSLASTFIDSTRLKTLLAQPSGAPGQRGTASRQSYGTRQVSYRYAFLDHNVLSYIELDGPQGRFSLADAVRLALVEDQRIRVSLE